MSVDTAFSCADLMSIQVKQNQIMTDENHREDLIPYTAAGVELINRQTASFEILKDPQKDREVAVSFIVDCDDEESGDLNECIVAGNEATVNCEYYSIQEGASREFKVTTNKFRVSTYSKEEFIARQMIRRKKMMEEDITRFMIQKLLLHKGTNAAPLPFTQTDNVTLVPAAAMNGNLFTHMKKMLIKNKMSTAFGLSGDNLFLQKETARLESLNANGSGENAKVNQLPFVFDLFNVDAEAEGGHFLISPDAYSFVSKTRYPDVPVEIGGTVGQTRWREPSLSLPGLMFDIIYTITCDSSGNGDLVHAWKIMCRYDMFFATKGCNGNKTGILYFECL